MNEKHNKQANNINVFIANGELESDLQSHIIRFIETLKAKQYQHIKNIDYMQIAAAGHSDSSPMFAVQSIQWLDNLQKEKAK